MSEETDAALIAQCVCKQWYVNLFVSDILISLNTTVNLSSSCSLL